MIPGPHPDFGFAGAWLYPPGTTHPIIHLIACDDLPAPTAATPVDHIAFRCEGLAAHLERLRDRGNWFRAAPVPGTPFTQVHHFDPNGIKVEATFENEPVHTDLRAPLTPPPYVDPPRVPDRQP